MYAVGIYVDRESTKKALQPRYGKQKAIASKQKFFDGARQTSLPVPHPATHAVALMNEKPRSAILVSATSEWQGLSVNPPSCVTLMSWKGKVCALCHADVVRAESVGKTLRIVIAYGGLTRTQFLNALEERLAPPLKAVSIFPK